MKEYKKTHTNTEVLNVHIAKIKKRGGKYSVKNNVITYSFLKTKKLIKVYRTITVKNKNKIDFNNFGNHWTFDENFDVIAKIGGNYKDSLQFSSLISINDINKEATMQSNIDFPHEFECVLNENTKLKITPMDEENGAVKGNSGNKIDKWVESADCSEAKFKEVKGVSFREFVAEIENWD